MASAPLSKLRHRSPGGPALAPRLHRAPTSGFKFQISNFQSRVSNFRFQVSALLLPLLLALSACTTTPRAYVEPPLLTAPAQVTHNLAVFDAVWQLVHDKYFDPHFRGVDWLALRDQYRPAAIAATSEAELYRVLDRLCAQLRESHLTPLPPRRTHEIRTARRMAVGMGWAALDGRQVVTELVPGGPADTAGVRLGWVVLSCDDQPLGDGPPPAPQPGRPVTYGFLDLANQSRAITFQPQLLKTTQLVSRLLPDGHLYLRFDHFNRESLQWLSQQLKTHRDAPGVVLDLRENRGGYLYAFNLAIAEFFDRRVPTGQYIRRSGHSRSSYAWGFFSARYAGRVALLTGPATGSAAEIFAHVMQHEKRATLIGRRTAGAVIVSRTYRLPGGGTLQIPTQDYRGRDGLRLEGRGVMPDIGVPPPALADLRHGRDPDLEMALTTLGAPAHGIIAARRGEPSPHPIESPAQPAVQ